MYRILFVDDDKLILRKFYQILDWNSLGFEIAGDATDGLQAIQMIDEALPDVVISDVNMPNMDGIELAVYTKKHHPGIRFIMLTVNDSFVCAQKALNIGVCHYLLKPIEREELESLILKIKNELENTHRQDLYVSGLKSKANISEQMIKDKFLNWFASGRQTLSEAQIIERFSFYNIPVHAEMFQMISIHLNEIEKYILTEQGAENMVCAIENCVENILCEYNNYVTFTDPFYNVNILIGSKEGELDLERDVMLICHSLYDTIQYKLRVGATILFSSKYKGYQNIYRCYYETKYISIRNVSGNRSILSCEDIKASPVGSKINLEGIREHVLKQLRIGEMKSLFVFLRGVFLECEPHRRFEAYNILRVECIVTGIMFIHESKLDMREIFDSHFEPLEEILEKDDIEECLSFIVNFYGTVLDYICTNKISSGRRLAEKCVELIDQNLSDPALTVKWLASQLYINDNYLSMQFRKEMGIPLIKYLGNEKLVHAKAYLDQGYTNLQVVAKLTGFNDPLYFSKCFKKRFGVAPSKYIQTTAALE